MEYATVDASVGDSVTVVNSTFAGNTGQSFMLYSNSRGIFKNTIIWDTRRSTAEDACTASSTTAMFVVVCRVIP